MRQHLALVLVLIAVIVLGCNASDSSDDGGSTDAPRACDGAVLPGCACNEPERLVCPIQLTCSEGRWQRLTADACGENDAGRPCTDEGAFTCAAVGEVCCGGLLYTFGDGPCGGPTDAGGGEPHPDCAAMPTLVGCPCDTSHDAGTDACVEGTIGACVGGSWQATTHVCPSFCDAYRR